MAALRVLRLCFSLLFLCEFALKDEGNHLFSDAYKESPNYEICPIQQPVPYSLDTGQTTCIKPYRDLVVGAMAASVRLNEDYQDLQDCCLIQDTLFYLEGKGCLYAFAGKHVEDRNHNVILCIDSLRNHLLLDVGLSSLSQKMKDHFSKNNNGIVLRKNDDNFRSSDDPLCMIHALLCKTSDIVPYTLVQSAAHDAMEGYAGSAVGVVKATESAGCLSNFILPMAILIRKPFFLEISHETPQLVIIPVAMWEGEIYGLERASKHVL